MSDFFAYLSRMKFIRRWSLMHNTWPENIQEHSLRVAMIAHALALIRRRIIGGDIDIEQTVLLAIYHDASEVLTGDLPSPVKYFNPDMRGAYQQIEFAAIDKLLATIPEALRADYRELFRPQAEDPAALALVKAADKLCAWLKCLEERGAGNPEFAEAEKTLEAAVRAIELPEVDYFIKTFVPSFGLRVDELD